MRDEKEERKKQARSNKQTRQSNTAHPRQSLFLYMYVYCMYRPDVPATFPLHCTVLPHALKYTHRHVQCLQLTAIATSSRQVHYSTNFSRLRYLIPSPIHHDVCTHNFTLARLRPLRVIVQDRVAIVTSTLCLTTGRDCAKTKS